MILLRDRQKILRIVVANHKISTRTVAVKKNVAVSIPIPVHSVCAECYKRSISIRFRSTSNLDGLFPVQ